MIQQKPTDGALSPELLHTLRTPLNHIIGYSDMLVDQAVEDGGTAYVPDLRKIGTAGRQMLALLSNDSPPSKERAPNAGATAARKTSANTLGARIVVVDDDEMNRDVLSRRLQHEGYEVAMAENGREALDKIRAGAFDLVLLDIMMPEMDGYQVLGALKADDALRHIPVIMLSALSEMDSVVRCIELGAEDYLSKPFDPTLLKARLGACLEKKAAHDRETDLFNQLGQNYKRLQDLERLRDDLTHMIVHDLRTPLSSLISGIQTVPALGELNEAQTEVMDIAIASGATLLEILDRVAENRPALILLDLMMPEKDGFEFAASMHEHPEWRTIPIVVLTAKDLTPDELRRLNGNVHTILEKGGRSRDELMRQVGDMLAGWTITSGAKMPAGVSGTG